MDSHLEEFFFIGLFSFHFELIKMIKNSLLVAWIFLTFTATGVIWLGQHNPDLLEKISLGLIPHNLGSDKEIKFESTIDKY